MKKTVDPSVRSYGKCLPMPHRSYQSDVAVAARQLVVAELIDAYRVQCEKGKKGRLRVAPFEDFYESDTPTGNRFFKHYQREWRALKRLGPLEYRKLGERTSDFAQAVGRGRESANAEDMAAVFSLRKKALPQIMTIALSQNQSANLYVCGAFAPTAATMALVTAGIQWMVDQGYAPASVAMRAQPGGAHRDAFLRPPCGIQKWRFTGMYVLVGLYPERTPCTIRHEVGHSIYHQLEKSDPELIKTVKEIYKNAMEADAGLFFNDEFYMDTFLHAGHPMHNVGEFFASAAHAITHHPERVQEYLNDPKTPPVVRHYAQAMVTLLQNRAFPRKKS